ncbi:MULTISPECIES: nuclear transport factor 2 family protein [Rhodococcus]|uniref:nuclear transport factor 2 family protein n=1 Tax=Rhodococcus TaxID=1827 RepID=UPI001C52861E
MNEDLKNLLDKQAITDVIHRYCRGVDRCDVEILKSVYHSDSYDDHGYWNRKRTGVRHLRGRSTYGVELGNNPLRHQHTHRPT